MAVLHTLNTLADQGAALRDCIRTLEKDDVLVLMEEATTSAEVFSWPLFQEILASQCDIYFLPVDDETFPGPKAPKPIKNITYYEFVDLCCRCSLIQNWY